MAKFCNQCGKPMAPDAHFCTSCGATADGKTYVKKEWKVKREKVMGKRRKKNSGNILIFACSAAVLVLAYYFWPKGGNRVIQSQPVVAKNVNYGNARKQMMDIPSKVENGNIIISLDAVKEKKFVAFSYEAANKSVPLLAYISHEGKLVTAVSMCEPCDSRRFHIKGNQLVCNSCGSNWDVDSLEPISGSCSKYPPDVVPSTIAGNEVLIDENLIKKWQPRN